MKRFNGVKGFVCGLLVGGIGITSVFAAGGIKSADFNSNIVIFDGKQLALSQPMISVVNEGEVDARNYMPVRAVLEGMGFAVDWDGSRNAVIVNSPKLTTGYYDEFQFPNIPDFAYVVKDKWGFADNRREVTKDAENLTISYIWNGTDKAYNWVATPNTVDGTNMGFLKENGINNVDNLELLYAYTDALKKAGFYSFDAGFIEYGTYSLGYARQSDGTTVFVRVNELNSCIDVVIRSL